MNKKVALIILDGFGLRKQTHGNAIALAKKPTIDMLFKNFPMTSLQASENAVGLPKGQMGNSEVGHLNIGAGRIVYTGLSLIDKEIETGNFNKNESFNQAFEHVIKNHSKLHIWGLTSYGGVHSNLTHIIALIKLAKSKNIPIVIHCIGDGRDVDPKTLINDIDDVIKLCDQNTKIGSISGRYYAMDRDKRWDRIEQAYQTMLGNYQNTFNDIKKYINDSYQNDVTDEFLLPAFNTSYSDKKQITIEDNDAIIFANFRPDRARELSHCIFGSNYYDYQPPCRKQNLFFVTMMTYEGIVPSSVAYPQVILKNTLGEVISKNNLSQLRVAETEKYAHVTFFFDGGTEIVYPNETKIIVPSPKVATYDLQPQMSANEVCDKILQHMDNTDVIIANFANSDMVGHTGNLEASIKAIETIDGCLKKIFDRSLITRTTLFMTADHGNADMVLDDNNKPVTAHTLNPVPFVVTDKNIKLIDGGKLANIAPTILQYLGINIPKEMEEKSLING